MMHVLIKELSECFDTYFTADLTTLIEAEINVQFALI